jgi:AcrR family transcriptional regulator
MPKVVDHEKLRAELAEGAAELFLRRGYSALGMREIAERLGVSKSALYHYFPSKRALFDAAGRVAVARMVSAFVRPADPNVGIDAAVSAILVGVKALDANARDEIALLTDYLRTVEGDAAARRGIAEANVALEASIAAIVGTAKASLVLSLCYGFLLQRVLAGESADFARFENELRELLRVSASASRRATSPR